MPTTISVFSDVICPWCFVGKRRLERALDVLGLSATTTVEWLPFELNPDMPEAGRPRAEYRAAKFGAERSAVLDREMTERGREEGIAFAFDRITRTPSTRRAHRLIVVATGAGCGDAVKTALMQAYFEEARDVGDRDVLVAVAVGAGLDREIAAAAIDDPAIDAKVVDLEAQAHRIGVSGVPFFIVDGSWAVSGAQATESWIAALREKLAIPADAAA